MRIAGLVLLCAVGQAADLKMGAPAPLMAFAQVLQAPEGTSANWANLKGTAVVLEFWATWCPGCVQQIPHLNRLSEQFRGKPVRFISATDEEPDLVQRFLKDHAISGWIGIDAGGQTFRNYGIEGRPQTALIDAAGVLRAIGNPSDLTGEILENLLAGKPIAFSNKDTSSLATLQSAPAPIFQMTIRPAAPVAVSHNSPGAVGGQPGRSFQIWGVQLRRLLNTAYGIREDRIEAPDWSRDAYDAEIVDQNLTPERRSELLQRLLRDTFQLQVHKESRMTAGYVLQRRNGAALKLREAASGASSHWGNAGHITAVSRPVLALATVAEQQLGKPVFDETGLKGRYDFELQWDTSNPTSFFGAVRDQLGLELVEARRPAEYLVVDSAVRPRTW